MSEEQIQSGELKENARNLAIKSNFNSLFSLFFIFLGEENLPIKFWKEGGGGDGIPLLPTGLADFYSSRFPKDDSVNRFNIRLNLFELLINLLLTN